MDNTTDFSNGWYFMNQILTADIASNQAYSDFIKNIVQNNQIHADNELITSINLAIDELKANLDALSSHNLDIEQLKGFIAEEWQASTFNIDAIKKGSEHRSWTLQETGYASVDIDTNFGKKYSVKYSNTAKDAENMQAALDKYTREPKYSGQERLIADEQLPKARRIARQREIRNILTRPEVSKSHKDTSEHLVGKISDDEGVTSKQLSIAESKQIAKEVKKDGFDPDKHGYSKQNLIKEVQIDYLNRALNAGLTAASITAITQLVPQIYKTINYLIHEGEIDLNFVKQATGKVITSSGESFLRGSIAYAVEMSLQNGLFGETSKSINPTIVGSIVAIILGTVKDSILVASGKLTTKEMGNHFFDAMVVSSGYYASMQVGGKIVQALVPNLPIIGYAIGSLLGCSISVVYNIGKRKLISFCIDSGFTCFGLVEQNYEIPEQALLKMGVQFIPVPKTTISTTQIETVNVQNQLKTTHYETVEITVLKRGILGINKIGYVL